MELRGLDATRRLAESVAAALRPGDVIGLDGDLGAGKTTFVRFLARALGVTTPVTSPTFTLANIYEAPARPAPAAAGPDVPESAPPAASAASPVAPAAAGPPLLIHHIDAYRLDGDADAEDLALGELLDSGGIVVVEWAERLTLPPDRLDLHFAYPPEPTAAPDTALGAVPVASAAAPAPVADGAVPVASAAAEPAVSAADGAVPVASAAAPAPIAEPAARAVDPDPAAPGAAPGPGAAPPVDPPDPAARASAAPVDPPDAADHRIVTITPHGPDWQARREPLCHHGTN